MNQMNLLNILLFVSLFLCGLSAQANVISPQIQQPHRTDCYTQGLFFINQTHLFESCGLYNKSFFRLMTYKTEPFKIDQIYQSKLPWKEEVFFEGATLFKGYIYVMTWREHRVFRFDPETLQLKDQLYWGSQGWGLTHNGTHMFCTDGSDIVYVLDENFKVLQQKNIKTQSGRKAYYLNQLQYVDGYLYANIYYDRYIHKINYSSGQIEDSYDGLNLIQNEKKNNKLSDGQVFNGIAYNQNSQKFVVTGKNWATMYEVQL